MYTVTDCLLLSMEPLQDLCIHGPLILMIKTSPSMIKTATLLIKQVDFDFSQFPFNLLFIAGEKGCPCIWELINIAIFSYHISNLVQPRKFTIMTIFMDGWCIANQHFLGSRRNDWSFIVKRFHVRVVFS